MPKGHKAELPAEPSTLEELRAARTSTSNKISGVNTQIKRATAAHLAAGDEAAKTKLVKRVSKLERRLETLLAERSKLSAKITVEDANDKSMQAQAAATPADGDGTLTDEGDDKPETETAEPDAKPTSRAKRKGSSRRKQAAAA